jgi:hypothetical protein
MDRDLPPTRPIFPGDDQYRYDQVRRELDGATPSVGSAGFLIGAVILIILALVLFGPPFGDNATNVASRNTIQTPAPTTPPNNP